MLFFFLKKILVLAFQSNSFFVQRRPWQSAHGNVLMKLNPENKSWHPCSCSEHGFDLNVCVIATQTPHIFCTVDLFLVAGITFLTCHCRLGKFSIINHDGDTSMWGVSLKVKPWWNGSPLPKLQPLLKANLWIL